MNIVEGLEKWVIYGLYLMFILTIINSCNSCNSNRGQTRLKKELINLKLEVDSLYNIVQKKPFLTKEEMKQLLNENMWKFLEIEELSDKNHIPINQFKHNREKHNNPD